MTSASLTPTAAPGPALKPLASANPVGVVTELTVIPEAVTVEFVSKALMSGFSSTFAMEPPAANEFKPLVILLDPLVLSTLTSCVAETIRFPIGRVTVEFVIEASVFPPAIASA